MPAKHAACDLTHRIPAARASKDGCAFLCCDSRQCLFKVESDGRLYCRLEKVETGGV